MSIERQEILKIAHLARLDLRDSELETLTRHFNTIVDYVRQLQAVDTSAVEPFAHAVEVQNVFRPDEPAPSLDVEAALANAPARQANFYRVPGVFES